MKKKFAMAAALAGVLAATQTANAHGDHGDEKAAKGKPAATKASTGAEAKGQCHGVNTCKGTTECGVDGAHGCHYQNACKGKGWLSMTEKACKEKKGTFKKI